MEDKQLVAELRKKYIENPPEGMTTELVKNMSDSDLLDMSYFLSEGDYDDEYDDEGFFIFLHIHLISHALSFQVWDFFYPA